ncbi:Rieske (2Fe-2S) protein [Rhodococcus rhodochrous]|uniref:Rieske (2Fe-2S) protein n=1 Tax=Rhodococcus rhodochrous TaxID=1829 RepID=UPI0009C02CD9
MLRLSVRSVPSEGGGASERRRPVDYDVGTVDAVLTQGRAVVEVGPNRLPVLVVRTRRGLFPADNRCPHRGIRLDDGAVRGTTITCAVHGYRFDLGTGSPKVGRTTRHSCAPLRVYPVRCEGRRLIVTLDEE